MIWQENLLRAVSTDLLGWYFWSMNWPPKPWLEGFPKEQPTITLLLLHLIVWFRCSAAKGQTSHLAIRSHDSLLESNLKWTQQDQTAPSSAWCIRCTTLLPNEPEAVIVFQLWLPPPDIHSHNSDWRSGREALMLAGQPWSGDSLTLNNQRGWFHLVFIERAHASLVCAELVGRRDGNAQFSRWIYANIAGCFRHVDQIRLKYEQLVSSRELARQQLCFLLWCQVLFLSQSSHFIVATFEEGSSFWKAPFIWGSFRDAKFYFTQCPREDLHPRLRLKILTHISNLISLLIVFRFISFHFSFLFRIVEIVFYIWAPNIPHLFQSMIEKGQEEQSLILPAPFPGKNKTIKQ